jgi:hypothetical protein
VPNYGPIFSARVLATSGAQQEAVMEKAKPAYYDLKTVATLREAVEEAWLSLPLQKRAVTSRALLAEPVLKLAAQGERDLYRLRDYALMAVTSSRSTNAAA